MHCYPVDFFHKDYPPVLLALLVETIDIEMPEHPNKIWLEILRNHVPQIGSTVHKNLCKYYLILLS